MGRLTDYLFDRSVSIEFGTPGQLGKKFTDLRVVFEIKKTITSEPNKGKIQIYNLSKASQTLAEKKQDNSLYVKLYAGYGLKLGTVFTGDVIASLSRRENGDVITEFEVGDGEGPYVETTINKSFSPGVSFKDVLTTAAKSFGLPVNTITGVKDEQFINGLAVSGQSKDVMDNLTKKQDLRWSIQNGAIQVTGPDGKVEGRMVLLSSDSGLIGSPKKKEKGKFEFISLLQPNILPGSVVRLESKFLKGDFIAQTVIHKGDSVEGDYFTTIEADLP